MSLTTSDRELFEQMAAGIAVVLTRLPAAEATQAGAACLAARSLAEAAGAVTGAAESLPAATRDMQISLLVEDVLERAVSAIQAEGIDRAAGATLEVKQPAPGRDLTGHTLSGYHLEERLGSGGFGAVYRGRNAAGMVAAVKVLHQDGQASRLLDEARVLGNLAPHKGIVRLLYLSLDNPAHLVFEYVDGPTLRAVLLEEGALPQDRVQSLILGTLEALHHAHTGGVLHLDLKPENLMLTGGVIKLVDFGLGRCTSQAVASLANSLMLTRGDQTGGTPVYMAPERLAGDAPDARADLFSLGIVCFELLTGRTPTGLTRLPECSPALARFLDAACRADPADRVASAAEAIDLFAGVTLGRADLRRLALELETAGNRYQYCSSVLDSATARQLAAWGRRVPEERSLHLSCVNSLDPATGKELAAWGRGDGWPRKLVLNRVNSLDPATAKELAAWGREDRGPRSLHLDGVHTLDPATASELAAWGRGESGPRELHLCGLYSLDRATAKKLLAWGRGDRGERILHLYLRRLDRETVKQFAHWCLGSSAERRLTMYSFLELSTDLELSTETERTLQAICSGDRQYLRRHFGISADLQRAWAGFRSRLDDLTVTLVGFLISPLKFVMLLRRRWLQARVERLIRRADNASLVQDHGLCTTLLEKAYAKAIENNVKSEIAHKIGDFYYRQGEYVLGCSWEQRAIVLLREHGED